KIPSPVLIVGESGSGKELVARQLHRLGANPTGPFIALNAAAIPENLLEDELFGHERGAFTGAAALRKGAFEAASGGTLFLDEIGELPPAAQAELLRVIEQRQVTRLHGAPPPGPALHRPHSTPSRPRPSARSSSRRWSRTTGTSRGRRRRWASRITPVY